MNNRKIIVLTPVKNEAWILERFLQVTSLFADHIIIADQNSTDGSLEVYRKYSKVDLIKNNNVNYDESDRQLLLIDKARQLYGLGNILLAIDADEVLAADAMASSDWDKMLKAAPGTILFFEKPTLYKDTNTAIRYLSGGWPLGYVDDGALHKPSVIHSTRIPTPDYASKLYLHEIKFLHYALVRLDAQASKQRMYSMLENIKGTKPLRERRRVYPAKLDFTNEGDKHEIANRKWFEGWEDLGIDMHTIPNEKFYWYDYEALTLFKKFGVNRFYSDDIWNFDWEKCRLYALAKALPDVPVYSIQSPRGVHKIMTKLTFQLINASIQSVRHLRNRAVRVLK